MSVAPRLYLDMTFQSGAELELDKDASHYLVTVMRRKPGDEVRVFNGRDGEWRADVAVAHKRAAILQIRAQTRLQSAAPDMAVYFAPVKKQRTDFIVEKATELGAASVTAVMTARTTAERVRTERLSALVREAAEQTERLDLPAVNEPVALTQLLKSWDGERRLIFADEAGEAEDAPWGGDSGRAQPIAQALAAFARPAGKWALLIGPEGGFAPEERALLRAQPFVVPVSLGPRILRADTALAAALSVWQAVLGDWD